VAGDLAAWTSETATEATQTLDRAQRARTTLPQALHAELDRLAAARERLLSRIRAVADSRIGGLKIRCHGDYHLGQVLLSKNDFVIIDFEGEPGRALAERRRKHSPLKDVAGMLRSFNYAHHSALLHATEHRPEMLATLAPLAVTWEKQVREAFLGAYRSHVEGSPLYGSFDAAAPLLALFELEKALYELRYDRRPDWVAVPLRGILAFT
jgi:maltose alpha-D-glucosyltransferase/alpha-amylase